MLIRLTRTARLGARLSTALSVGALTLLVTQPVLAQASVNGRIDVNLGSCGSPGAASPASGTPTSLAIQHSYSGGGCTLFASGFGYLGVAGATARTSWNTGDWSSGNLSATASGSWNDYLTASWNSLFSVNGVRKVRISYSVGATGSVSATANPITSASAGIDYDLQVGNSAWTGSQTSGGATTGTWGSVIGSLDFDVLGNANAYNFVAPSVKLGMNGRAGAGVGKTYLAVPAVGSADANFGSTLIWGGVTGVQAFDANDNQIALQTGFRISLTGQQTGADYWDAAVRAPSGDPTTTVPEPSTWVLLGVGLLAIVAMQRNRDLRERVLER